ncbi:hypothetical protein BX661DRAFT_197974 [Kickxella alabastrina]|uniref:uncharacterized protein n=1 Tax=Kickxella alabastrina TaxID=61397 RepID=UPI0022203BE7|nr:uncharacterized protein BX661DRAFT_197974 [Kickxella alabastrina]KAI7829197.1 hypothetical protein BX661DRAFT_197974 [Kickxella alabastrina]
MTQTIAIVGATGLQDGSVLKTLYATGKYKIRALTRDTSSNAAKSLVEKYPGIELASAGLGNIASLRQASKGAHIVFSVTSTWWPMTGTLIMTKSTSMGVESLVFSSLGSLKANSNGKYPGVMHFESKHRVEEYILSKENQIRGYFVYVGFYFENLINSSRLSLEDSKTIEFVFPLNPTTEVPIVDTANDVGAVVSYILDHPEESLGKARELVEAFTEATGIPARYVQIPVEQIGNDSLIQGLKGIEEFGGFDGGAEFIDRNKLLIDHKFATPVEFWKNRRWTGPAQFSNFNKLLEESLELTDDSPTFEQLKQQLAKLKPDLAGLFEYPGKNLQHRAELEKGTPSINGEKFKVSDDFISEAKKLSDFLDIDEDIAAALVHKAGPFEKRFELPAAESAVLLFFSEREAKLASLTTIFVAGGSQAVDESHIKDLKTKQGKRDVVEFALTKLGEERKQLAMLMFAIIRNYQLNSGELIAVVEWLRSSSVDDPVTLRMSLALLTALSTSAEGANQELAEATALDKINHLVRDSQFLVKLNAEIIEKPWSDDGLKGLIWLQWALLALFGMKRSPGFDHLIGFREDRVERIAEQAIQMGAYRFAVDYLLGYRITDDIDYELSAEFEVLQRQHTSSAAGSVRSSAADSKKQRYPHFLDISEDLQWHIEHMLENTVAAFIGRMSSLIRRMRYSEEDAIYQAQQAELQRAAQEEQRQLLLQQQQHQQLAQSGYRYSRPINNQGASSQAAGASTATSDPRRDTEALFLLITVLYSDRPDAGLRFWGRPEGGQIDLDDRLAVFLRWGSDCREPGMIRGACAHDFMSASENSVLCPSRGQVASNQAPLCSWPALFGALDFYASQMRQSEPDPLSPPPEIPEPEVALLRSFLRLCRSVVRYSIVARSSIYDSTDYSPMITMFNLLGLIDTIAAFGELCDETVPDSMRQAISEMARRSWALLEQSQTLPTTSDIDSLRNTLPAGAHQRGMTIGRGSSSTNSGGSHGREIEAPVETYPEMRAFVRLVGTLIHTSSSAPALSNMERDPILYTASSPSIPIDLGESYRIPGISPYVGFVLDHKWRVYALSLDVVERCLGTMDLSGLVADTNSSAQQQQQGRTSRAPDASALRALVTHPGFEIAIRILCGSKLLETLLHVLSVGVDTLNSATGDLGESVSFSVLSTLRILLRILRIQDTLLCSVVPTLLESSDVLGFPLSLPRSLTTLENLLLSRRQSVILHILSDSPVFNGVDDSLARVGLIDNSDESLRIMHGFISCLEADDNVVAESQSGALISEAARGFTSGLEDQQPTAPLQSIRLAIIDLLLANISPNKPAPTIAHYLLGFSLTKPTSDDLPEMSQRATCMHTILDILRRDHHDFESYDIQSSALLVQRPRLAERCLHLIYHLCSDPVTSDVTMRYLRARENFFYTQMSTTPSVIVPDLQETDGDDLALGVYSPIKVYAQMHARAWLWRSTALELHTLVLQDSRSRAKLLVEWLVSDASQQDGGSADCGEMFSLLPGRGAQGFLDSRIRLLAVFDSLRQAYRDSSVALSRQQRETEREYLTEFSNSLAMDEDEAATTSDQGKAAYFDTDILNVDINSCTVANERGCAVYDLHALVALLRQAERVLEANGELSAAATRQRVNATIRRLVIRCYFANQERELYFAYASALRGWKEIAEIVVTSAWDKIETGGRIGRERTAFQLLHGLVQVIAEVDPVYHPGKVAANAPGWWIGPPTAEQEMRHTELMTALASTLTLFTERLSSEWIRAGILTRASLAMNKPGISGQSRQLPPAVDSQLPVEPLIEAWKLLVGAALTPAAQSSLQLRGNVYASMLHFLGGVRKLAAAEAEDMPSLSSVGVNRRNSKNKLVAGALSVLANSTLGDRLLESVSSDAADASDAWKTVAFSLLDALTTLFNVDARVNRVVQFLVRKNFFVSFVGSILRREDQAIQTTLHPDPASLNPLYIYEAKMAFFLRLAQRQEGAEKLMESGILDVLADCAFLGMRPSVSSEGKAAASYTDAFIPARIERYHQLLMPALNLLLVLVTRIGRDNLTLWMKAARFVSQHHSVLEAVLKEVAIPAQTLSIALLTEAKAITSLVFYIGRQRAVLEREAALAGSGHVGVSSLHLPMLALLPKFATSSNWTKRLVATNDVERAQAYVSAAGTSTAMSPNGSDDMNGADSGSNELKGSVFGQQASELVDAVVRNALSYAQAMTEQPLGGVGLSEAARLFRPAFSWAIEHSRESDYMPSLATLTSFVRRSLHQIERGRRTRDEKLRLAKNSGEMTTADLRKLVGASPYVELSEDLAPAQMRALGSVLLTQQAQRIGKSTAMLVSAVEQALVLFWRHLSFFMGGGAAAVSNGGECVYGSVGRAQSSIVVVPTLQERELLRSDVSITLPPLLTLLSELKLSNDEVANAATHMSFVQMLVRRIKDLVLREGSVV